MLRFLPFYFTFLALLCAPVEFARADGEASFLGTETCTPLSDAEWNRRLKDPNAKINEVARIRAQRSGLLDRQCAEMINILSGASELVIVAILEIYNAKHKGSVTMQGMRSTRDLLTRRGGYLTPAELIEKRKYDTFFIREGYEDEKLHRIPGLADGQAKLIRDRFLATIKEQKTFVREWDGILLKVRREGTGRLIYTKGEFLEIEVHNTKIVGDVKGANGTLPDYAREALQHLSPEDVETFNNPLNRAQWAKLASFRNNTEARAFWTGVVEGLKPEIRQELTRDIVTFGGKTGAEISALRDAFEAGKAFVARTEANRGVDFEIKLAYDKETIKIDGSTVSRETFISGLIRETEGRVLSGKVGPLGRPPRQRMLTTLGIGALLLHGVNNLAVAYNNINYTNADAHGDFCPEPYCNDEDSFLKELSTKWSTGGIGERIRSAGGWRRDQQGAAPPSAPASAASKYPWGAPAK